MGFFSEKFTLLDHIDFPESGKNENGAESSILDGLKRKVKQISGSREKNNIKGFVIFPTQIININIQKTKGYALI